ncbi:MAG TPA: TonB-dependent receptor [Vitreimonas sp.]|uniref:TonB-dependent receptor plug domain-containing protein n=1 Tax=Vitreimonas sp. TaxID=3069702 RepID=UPI002D6CCDE3|nr:TonB-dependent receptor [Vitreimonas sp.]HYD87166.1 TonB-dependent receptor [Vitreimonas sp.]
MARAYAHITAALCAACVALPVSALAQTTAIAYDELEQLSIEDLANLRISSVSLRAEPLSEAAASVYVITNDDLRRSGATSIPEALRLAPNLQVARDDAIDWSITARGSGNFGSANKLLVLIDGRSVYSPVFSGVFWDAQHRMLEDVDRIEVISGPGGTLYGANAVNGVINITTRDAFETQGLLTSVSLGDVDRTAAVRWGGQINPASAFRVFVAGYERGESLLAGGGAGDGWEGGHTGIRFDWRGADDSVTAQADGHINTYDVDQRDTNANVVLRWTRELDADASLETQFYWDQVDRNSPNASDIFNSYDLRSQLSMRLGGHAIVAGAGYRSTEDSFVTKLPVLTLTPARRHTEIVNVFLQDSINLNPETTLIVGFKAEHDTFVEETEILPNVRLAWRPLQDHLFWAAVSRATRTPNRFDRDLGLAGVIVPNDDFVSEELFAYELGYRGLPREGLSVSATFFYHEYDELRSIGPSGGGPALQFRNDIEGERWGVEAWLRTDLTDWWRMEVGGYAMDESFGVRPGAVDLSGGLSPGADADHQVLVRSQFTLAPEVELDLRLRHVGEIDEPSVSVPAYTEADARLGWRMNENLELYLAGHNLLDESHLENRQPGDPAFETRRRVSIGLRWTR